ncbi:MAG TPA: hypothetical protein VFE26_12550, partial [Trebonia sp.]|nr:hypothetical protein [Trebonia sp.]
GIGGLLALPVFALPAILAGVPVSPGLVHTALLGIAGFAAFAVFGEIASYWLPLLAGPPAYLLFRHRYGRPVFRRATPGGGPAADERKAGS